MKTQFGILAALAVLATAFTTGCGQTASEKRVQDDLQEANKQAQNGNTKAARDLCDRAIRLDPNAVGTFVYTPKDSQTERQTTIADIFAGVYDDPSLVFYMSQATQKFPKEPTPWLTLAQAYQRLGRVQDQQAAAKQAAALLEPTITKPGGGADPNKLNTLGSAYYMAGNMPQATQTLQSAITMYQAEPGLYNSLAYFWADANDTAHLTLAAQYANMAIQKAKSKMALDDDMRTETLAMYMDTLGWVQYRQKQYPAALTSLQDAVQDIPREPEVRYHLGMVYLALAKSPSNNLAVNPQEAARAEFQSALAIDPTYADAQAELNKLGSPPATASTGDDAGPENLL